MSSLYESTDGRLVMVWSEDDRHFTLSMKMVSHLQGRSMIFPVNWLHVNDGEKTAFFFTADYAVIADDQTFCRR